VICFLRALGRDSYLVKMTRRFAATVAMLASLVALRDSSAQVNPGDRTATVTPGAEYGAGSMTRKLLGNGWREIWLTPVTVPVLDVGTYAGGLVPGERGGHMQSITLHFKEKEGWREYIFRSVNKFPVKQAMPAAIKGSLVGRVIQDQTSALFPAAALAVPPFLKAVGVLTVVPELYVMPRDPRLGVYQDTFAVMLGTMELDPEDAPNNQPGFAGSKQIKSALSFLDEIEKDRMHRLNEREFFAARLVDLLINDTDRTDDNFRFARYGEEGKYTWRPLPRDRDRAFMDARGLVTTLFVRPLMPKVVAFTPTYSMRALTYDSHVLDRRLLQRLTRQDAEEIGLRVRNQITNSVIEEALAELPTEWRAKHSTIERLRATLRARRDALPDAARQFYAWLATDVDVHGTDQDEEVTIDRHADGRVTVTVQGTKDSSNVEPFSRRTFLPSETSEVRVYLHNGDDRAVVRGADSDAITVRVIGGNGDDVFEDVAGGGATRFYDASGENRFIAKSGTRVSTEEWIPPKMGPGIRLAAAWRPDWGGEKGWGPSVSFADGAGVVVGFGPRLTSYGFRRLPYRWHAAANALYATGNGRPGVNLSFDYRMENSPGGLRLDARATRFEAFRYHGIGNNTIVPRGDFELTNQDLIAIEPAFTWEIGWRARENLPSDFVEKAQPLPGLRPLIGQLRAGPVLYWNDFDIKPFSPLGAEDRAGTIVRGRVGARMSLDLDRTARQTITDRGWKFHGALAGYPPVWDVKQSFASVSAVASAYFPLPGDGTHLAFRLGGETVSGPFPPQHAAFIGGGPTVRGYRWQRFAGQNSSFGSAELRVPVGIVNVLLKWNAGVFALADAGRVWFNRESPGGWHTSVGGGLWFSALGQDWSVAYAHGEDNRFYLKQGLSF
jgi:hypothetical protein